MFAFAELQGRKSLLKDAKETRFATAQIVLLKIEISKLNSSNLQPAVASDSHSS
ncbi:MAG TPA: hypothetical protein PKK66_05965 [Bacteroidales bacterium]|nr:hypothetical protein [Bacteroidales bacterium]HPT52745.1 hypothetical protein [Bacteroidales bacterium]